MANNFIYKCMIYYLVVFLHNLSDSCMLQVAQIESLGAKHSVTILVERKRRLRRISINGCSKDVAAAVRDVYSLLSQVAQANQEREHAELLYQQVFMYSTLLALLGSVNRPTVMVCASNIHPSYSVFR